MRIVVWAVMLLLVTNPRHALGDHIGAFCDGDSVRIGIGAYGNVEQSAGYSLFLTARALGQCGSEIRIGPERLDYPDHHQEVTYSVRVAIPFPGRYTEYRLYRERPDGTAHLAPTSGDLLPWDLQSCSPNAVFARGVLSEDLSPYANYSIKIDVCEGKCWKSYPLSFHAAEKDWSEFVGTGQIVNVYGEAWVDGMPGASHLEVSYVRPVTNPDGCNSAVPIQRSSWASFRSRF